MDETSVFRECYVSLLNGSSVSCPVTDVYNYSMESTQFNITIHRNAIHTTTIFYIRTFIIEDQFELRI